MKQIWNWKRHEDDDNSEGSGSGSVNGGKVLCNQQFRGFGYT